jgi:lactate 2-monooxygenase
VPNYGEWQFTTYLDGLTGKQPDLPMSFAELARRAEHTMSQEMWSYVAGGAGDEHTQDGNVLAFRRYGLVPRMLRGAAERDLSVELLGRRLPTPLMLAPVGVIGLCEPEGHGDLTTARAAAALGVPMIASTLSQDPMEDVAAQLGDTPGWFQLYPPNDRELTESLVARAEAAGFSAIVVTLDTLTLGWRPRDLQIASFPQLKGLCLANYFSDPVFRSRLATPPEQDPQAATGHWSMVFGNQRLTWDDLAWLRSLTSLLGRRRPARRRQRHGRHLLLQPRRSAGQRRPAGARLPRRGRRRRRRRPGRLRLGRAQRPGRREGAGARCVRRRRRPPVRVRPGRRRPGRHRARAAVPARRD